MKENMDLLVLVNTEGKQGIMEDALPGHRSMVVGAK